MPMQRNDLVRAAMDDFRRIVQALRTSHRAAENASLTGAQLFVLSVLHDADEAVSIGDIAREAQTDPSTASVVVGRLVKCGYVRRRSSSEDSRRVDLSLTAQGHAILQRIGETAPQRRLAGALQDLRAADAKILVRVLREITKSMGLATAPAPMMFDEEPKRRKRRR